ncbi:hypothetical protein D3C80_212810 [compost metagenome]
MRNFAFYSWMETQFIKTPPNGNVCFRIAQHKKQHEQTCWLNKGLTNDYRARDFLGPYRAERI